MRSECEENILVFHIYFKPTTISVVPLLFGCQLLKKKVSCSRLSVLTFCQGLCRIPWFFIYNTNAYRIFVGSPADAQLNYMFVLLDVSPLKPRYVILVNWGFVETFLEDGVWVFV